MGKLRQVKNISWDPCEIKNKKEEYYLGFKLRNTSLEANLHLHIN